MNWKGREQEIPILFWVSQSLRRCAGGDVGGGGGGLRKEVPKKKEKSGNMPSYSLVWVNMPSNVPAYSLA